MAVMACQAFPINLFTLYHNKTTITGCNNNQRAWPHPTINGTFNPRSMRSPIYKPVKGLSPGQKGENRPTRCLSYSQSLANLLNLAFNQHGLNRWVTTVKEQVIYFRNLFISHHALQKAIKKPSPQPRQG
jgi:hypothetical protein